MQRKKVFYYGICILMLFVLTLAGCSSEGSGNGTDEKTYTIDMQLYHARTQYLVQQAQIPFFERLEELSDGRLEFAIFDKNAISSDQILGTSQNLLQMSIGATTDYPGIFPLAEALRQPFGVPGSAVGGMTAWHLYETFPEWQEQFDDDLILLSHFTSATNQLHTKEPVRTLEDLDGMRIGTLNALNASVIQALGAIPVPTATTELAMSLDRGLIDGVVIALAPVRSLGFSEMAKYHTIIDLTVTPFFVTINRSFFESLPEDLQDLLVSNFGNNFAEISGKALDEGAIIDCEWMREEVPGTEFITLSPEEKARWKEKVASVADEYLEEMKEQGKYEIAQQILEERDSYTEQLISDGVYVPDYAQLTE